MSHDPVARPVAMVTGATAGIGRVFADRLAARGHDVALVARDAARLEEVAAALRASYGVETEVVVADLSDRDQLKVVEDRLRDPRRPVELLVNNAGFGLKQRFADNDVETEQALLDVHVTAVMRLSHAALGPMLARGHGGIINVSSVAAYLPRGTYGAAKAWVQRFSEWAGNEYRDRGVTVMALCPGFTKTEFHERLGARRGSGFLWMSPESVVDRALADFERRRAVSVPGAPYKLIAAVGRLLPARALQAYQSIGRK